MTSNVFKGLPPRVDIRIRDSITGSYPTIARTGDSRTGAFAISFDDSKTVIFSNSSLINLPTRLNVNSEALSSDLETDISVIGRTLKGVSDPFVVFPGGEEPQTPFFEDKKLYEQGRTSDFYLTGSTVKDTTLGFQSKLVSKTALRYSFPITSSIKLSPNTSSIYYYDFDLMAWERIRRDLETSHLDGSSEGILSLAGNEESKLFNYMGTMILTGALNGAGQSGIGSRPSEGGLIRALNPGPNEVSGAMTRLSSYKAEDRNLFSPAISHPFLLEKVIVEFPISTGPGWMDDKTTLEAGTGDGYSAGGPCLTFAIQKQSKDNHREVILSGTIIPVGDNFSSEFSTKGFHTTPQGFLSFANPHVVISGTNSQYSGTIKMELSPHVSNGVVSLGFATASIDIGPTFGESLIIAKNPFGRSMDGSSSGRSYFGKDFVSPGSVDQIKSPPRYSFTPSIKIYNVEQGAYSPYLLLPGDELLFSISKFRPVHDGDFIEFPTTQNMVLTGAHDVDMITGTMNVVFYGSQIREGVEHHDTLNQLLTSDAIHESIQSNIPAVDQFDVEGRSSFEGSYLDQYITGNLSDSSRGIYGSTILGTTPQFSSSLLRGVNVQSSERYFDTMMPRPDEIWSRDGFSILDFNAIFATNTVGVFVMGSRNVSDPSSPDTEYYNTEWIRSYPFEPRYQDISRTVSPLNSVVNENGYIVSSVAILRSIPTQNSKEQELLSDNLDYGVSSESKLLKSIYGIGIGSSGSAEFLQEESTPTSYRFMRRVSIRGWKYGILNGLPQNSRAIFRYDHFGHFRDMLEQRPYSKYYTTMDENNNIVTPIISTSPVSVKFSEIDPESTFSSNVSTEATSSLPYFDADKGDAGRNRGPLPDVEIVLP